MSRARVAMSRIARDFFLRNPEHRAALATPRAALALAEA